MTAVTKEDRFRLRVKADYEFAMIDYKTMLGCPQCKAEHDLEGAKMPTGFTLAALEVLNEPHECGAEKKDMGVFVCKSPV